MKQEDKDLLLRDLCARLPYGVKMNHIADDEQNPKTLIGIDRDYVSLQSTAGYSYVPVEDYKPYLFPLSSMTEEQKKEYNHWKHEVPVCHYEYGDVVEEVELFDSPESFKYLIENHFDYHGLIPMGLAIDCTNLNIY